MSIVRRDYTGIKAWRTFFILSRNKPTQKVTTNSRQGILMGSVTNVFKLPNILIDSTFFVLCVSCLFVDQKGLVPKKTVPRLITWQMTSAASLMFNSAFESRLITDTSLVPIDWVHDNGIKKRFSVIPKFQSVQKHTRKFRISPRLAVPNAAWMCLTDNKLCSTYNYSCYCWR